jgi:hypothetical protein
MRQFKSHTKYKTKSGLKIEFATTNYPLTLQGREEKETELIVEVQVKDSFSEEKIGELFVAEFKKEKNTINITAKDNKNIKSANIHLFVPNETSINLASENAPLSISDLMSKQFVKTENGPVEITGLNGKLVCESENGSVRITNSQGKIDITTKNGPISLKNCDAEIHINAENGQIKLKNCKSSLHSKASNGTIRITKAKFTSADIQSDNGGIYYEFLTCDKGDFKFQNDNGKIQVIIPDEIPYKIYAENDYGKFHINLGEDLEGIQDVNNENKKAVNIQRGSGNVKIYIKNENGSINIVKDSKHRSYQFGFEMKDVSKILEDAMTNIPNEFDLTKVNESIEKAKKTVENSSFPDINLIVKTAMKRIKKEINENKTKQTDLPEKVQRKVNSVLENFVAKFEDLPLSEKQQEKVEERSRLKILQMLQDGKITADEAEKLMKTMQK